MILCYTSPEIPKPLVMGLELYVVFWSDRHIDNSTANEPNCILMLFFWQQISRFHDFMGSGGMTTYHLVDKGHAMTR